MFRKTPYSSSTQLLEPQNGEISNTHELDEISSYEPSTTEYRSSAIDDLSCEVDRPLGKPCGKRTFDPIDTAAVLLSAACLAVSLAVISPRYDLSFRLGYTNQLVVIGFLLGIMNLCAKRVAQLPFLLFEANFGRSYLQNYDAILRDSPFVMKATLPWKIALFAFAALPFGLSASYKLFQGGSVTKPMQLQGFTYGLFSPAGLGTVGGELVVMANTTVNFLTASANDTIGLEISGLPHAFGLNALVLSSTSAAYLDLPAPEAVLATQRSLEPGTFYDITAIVRGTVTTYEDVTQSLRDDTTYWDSVYQYATLNTQDLFNNFFFGFMTINTANSDAAAAWDDSWSWIGCVDHDATASSNATQLAFQASALKFVTDRHICNATWRITREALRLIDGSCNSIPLNASYQYLENSELALQQVYTSILSSYLGAFCTTRNASSWNIITHAVTIAAMYYSRTSYLVQGGGGLPTQYRTYYENGWQSYNTTENVTLTKPVMLQAWALYFILACQPALTFFAFLVTFFFRQTPLGRGFGLVSILAGIDTKTVNTLRGASLSGELSETVRLEVTEIKENVNEQIPARVQYRIGKKGFASRPLIH